MTAGEMGEAGDITRVLEKVREGDADALDRLLPLVYEELQAIAARQLHRERVGHTLETAALVHEAYLKMMPGARSGEGGAGVGNRLHWQNRAHFFGIAARAMRQVLVDYARRRGAEKRGGEWARTTLTGKALGVDIPMADLLTLDDALDRLNEMDERLRQVVEYRFFGGMTEQEIAEALDVTPRTVQRDWVKARAWLYKELYPERD